jgi:hypothetical protein
MTRQLALAIGFAMIAAPLPAHAAVTWNVAIIVGGNTISPGGAHKTEAGCMEARKIATEALKHQKAKGIEVYCVPLKDTE